MFWYVLAVVYGVFVAVFPRRAIDYLTRLVLLGYENPEELEPSEWYVSLARLDGVLIATAGLLSILLKVVVSNRETTETDVLDA